MTARVPAKVNLQLSVGPPGADGYHDLVTVFHALALFDEVTVTSANTDSVVVTGEGARSVPLGPDNLAARAVAALLDAVGPGVRDSPGLAIEIRKRIPVAAGLAGGSADAAGALVACNELWGTGLSHQELSEVAARVGSDVGFALLGGTAVGLGRGDRVTPALAAGTYHWVLAFADGTLSTPEVYGTLDRLRAANGGAGKVAEPELSTELMSALRAGDLERLGRSLSNDLQAPAISLFPALRKTLDVGLEFGALGALVSGSGPTCLFLTRDVSHATDLAVALSGAGVCRTVTRASGPVPGATVIEQ